MPFKRQIFADGTCRTIKVDENGLKIQQLDKDGKIAPSKLPGKSITLGPNDVWPPVMNDYQRKILDAALDEELFGKDNIKQQSPKDQVIDQMNNEPKCTCGVDSVGYGIHSDWCDKNG